VTKKEELNRKTKKKLEIHERTGNFTLSYVINTDKIGFSELNLFMCLMLLEYLMS